MSVGQLVGRYRIAGVLGQGGMATVYLAVHEHIGKQAAIKVLDPPHAQNPETVARFLNEARAVNLVQHPGIINIFEFGHLESGAPYIAMDLLDGAPLSDRLQHPLPVPQALRLGREIALALQAAHDKGIVHRDLKPQNVMIVKDPAVPGEERAKLLDFGIAKLPMVAPPGEGASFRTRTGMLMGTPAYMAPEQCLGTGITDRTDVYALGVVLFQMLAGRLPFCAPAMIDLLGQHVHESPPPLQALCPFLAPEISALVHAMLGKEPERRPAMEQVALDLLRLAGASPAPPASPQAQGGVDRSAVTRDHLRPGPRMTPPAPQTALSDASRPSRPTRRALAAVAAGLLVLGLAVAALRSAGSRPPARAGARPAMPELTAGTAATPQPPAGTAEKAGGGRAEAGAGPSLTPALVQKEREVPPSPAPKVPEKAPKKAAPRPRPSGEPPIPLLK